MDRESLVEVVYLLRTLKLSINLVLRRISDMIYQPTPIRSLEKLSLCGYLIDKPMTVFLFSSRRTLDEKLHLLMP